MAINSAGAFVLGPVDEPLQVPTDFNVPSPRAMEITTSASNNTQMDAIPLWAVREWLRRNVNTNLAFVESKIVEMVGIAEQHHL